MIFGIGVDTVDIRRFERFVAEGNEALLNRLFTTEERAYCEAKKNQAQHYALRFAAKEAFLKACGLGLREGLSWRDMEVVNDSLGKPELKLAGKARQLFMENELKSCHVSLSHDGDNGVAMVVLER